MEKRFLVTKSQLKRIVQKSKVIKSGNTTSLKVENVFSKNGWKVVVFESILTNKEIAKLKQENENLEIHRDSSYSIMYKPK